MKALTMVALCLMTGFAAPSPAAPAAKRLFPTMARAMKAVAAAGRGSVDRPKAPARTADCVSFEGTWVGTCTYSDGTSDPDTLIIEQDQCSDLWLNEFDLPMGGIGESSATQSDDYSSSHRITAFPQWNAARNGVKIRFSVTGRALGRDLYYFGRGTSFLQIVDGRLLQRSDDEMEWEQNGNVQVSKNWTECEYSKQ